MRKLTQDEIYELIHYLQGTCMSLDNALEQLFELDTCEVENEIQMCNILDDAIFNCSRCGWWCEAGDWITEEDPNYVDGEEICTQCGNE